ncbi:MAG TPA: IMS domain-containing protein [Nostocaceae cyanobacterium]|nr:IMS domain-containing protein [Nostocaceae cyanobacterium]
MRIPLDYYRILGLPLAASEEQLRQAYSDRIVQLPRREYSTAAISSRKQLIEEAYVVLSNPRERSTYDQLYLAQAYDPDRTTTTFTSDNQTEQGRRDQDAQSLSIEITQDEFVGSLLILQELGEYELVLKLGRPYIVSKHGAVSVKTGRNLNTEENLDNPELPDIILTVALACLELGREQWQQGHYENAAISLETGDELLAQEGLFPNVRAEIAADLYRLRPYRILELLALPLDKTAERRQGLELLQSILSDRLGIDGTGNDQSGLNIDDFLRFIQQIRNYLTVAEQHKLFEAESKRPSAVATYLAVYALIARGFAQRQPALIRQAKQMLMRLGKRQDVHLEQSLCALLLGQTEEATRVLELSQEYEALAFIREKSQDSPDLLPGLCLYAEQWLQQEVFPHFRDLAKQQASLKDYFADSQVQAYLEALPTDAEITSEWAVINNQSFPEPQINTSRYYSHNLGTSRPFSHNHTVDADNSATSAREVPEYTQYSPSTPDQSPRSRTPQPNTDIPRSSFSSPSGHPQTKRRKPQPYSGSSREQVRGDRQRQRRRIFANTLEGKTRLVWTVFLSLLGLLVVWLLIFTTVNVVKNVFFPSPSLQGQQLAIELNRPLIEIPDPNSKPLPPDGPLTNTAAEEIIQTWLSTKAAALGPNHQVESLEQILTGSALSQWLQVAQQERSENRYRKYSHQLKVESVDSQSNNPNQARVEATVEETTQFYQSGQQKRSSRENLRVRYDLVRKNDGWRIQTMSVVNKLN